MRSLDGARRRIHSLFVVAAADGSVMPALSALALSFANVPSPPPSSPLHPFNPPPPTWPKWNPNGGECDDWCTHTNTGLRYNGLWQGPEGRCSHIYCSGCPPCEAGKPNASRPLTICEAEPAACDGTLGNDWQAKNHPLHCAKHSADNFGQPGLCLTLDHLGLVGTLPTAAVEPHVHMALS